MAGNENNKTIYKSWRFWAVLLIALVLIFAGVLITFGPAVIQKALNDPGTIAFVGVVGSGAAIAWRFLNPIYDELKKRIEKAESKAVIAEGKAEEVSKQADNNSQRSSDLEEQMRMFKLNQDNQQHYIDDLQEQRLSDKTEIADLKIQLRTALKEIESLLREITDLKTQLREVNRESLADKQEVVLLRAKVSNLEMEVAKLIIENSHLLDENRELKALTGGRRGTDKLSQLRGLRPDIQAEFDRLEIENKKIQLKNQAQEKKESNE